LSETVLIKLHIYFRIVDSFLPLDFVKKLNFL
jgi:hypothetical protein